MIKSRFFLFILTIGILAFAGVPLAAQGELIKIEAMASYYGDGYQGKTTSSGEVFNMNDFTAAHKTLPFGTMLEVTNLESGKKTVVRVNDRGPFVEKRELDVSKAAAEQLGMISAGIAKVSIRKIGESIALAEKKPGVFWRIQLGSFSKEDNATRLSVRLRNDGFNPSFEKTGTFFRVILNGVPDSELAGLKEKLGKAGYADFIIRQDS